MNEEMQKEIDDLKNEVSILKSRVYEELNEEIAVEVKRAWFSQISTGVSIIATVAAILTFFIGKEFIEFYLDKELSNKYEELNKSNTIITEAISLNYFLDELAKGKTISKDKLANSLNRIDKFFFKQRRSRNIGSQRTYKYHFQ